LLPLFTPLNLLIMKKLPFFLYCTLLLAFITSLTTYAQPGYISTVAGNGTPGYMGDGFAATAAELSGAMGITKDASGNMYVCDFNNNVVRKISTTGIITTIAGTGTAGSSGDGGQATAATFFMPGKVVFDAAGNLYVLDCGNNTLRKISTTGIVTLYAGGGVSPADGVPATTAQLSFPVGLAIDPAGNIYIGDQIHNKVRKVNTSGIITTVAGTGGTGYTGDGFAATLATLSDPTGISLDTHGNLYIADQLNHCIRKVTASTGIITTVAGTGTSGYTGDGGQATAATLYQPNEVTVDAVGNIFIADTRNNSIRKVNTAGVISTIAGNNTGLAGYSGDGGPATAAFINFPQGIYLDAVGNCFVGEYSNNVVRKINRVASTLSTNQTTVSCTLALLPNPNKGVFMVRGTMGSYGSEEVTLEVLDVSGQMVYTTRSLVENGNINTRIALENNLPNGVYMLKISSASESAVARFVIEH
jgi:trimeric autotransporter adhesin